MLIDKNGTKLTIVCLFISCSKCVLESSWNVMAYGDAREGKWWGNWRMEWVSVLFAQPRNMEYPALLLLMRTPRLPVVDWTDAPCRFKWTRPFRRKTKPGFCACAITFQTQSAKQIFAAVVVRFENTSPLLYIYSNRKIGLELRDRLQMSPCTVPRRLGGTDCDGL